MTSISSIEKPKTTVENRKTVVVNQSLATSGSFSYNFEPNLHFKPRYAIIKQILYSNIAGSDSGTFLIWSSFSSSHIGAFYIGIQANSHFPETKLTLTTPNVQSVDFIVTPANVAFTGPTGQITMTIEFCD